LIKSEIEVFLAPAVRPRELIAVFDGERARRRIEGNRNISRPGVKPAAWMASTISAQRLHPSWHTACRSREKRLQKAATR
jgi:hypothetical protein